MRQICLSCLLKRSGKPWRDWWQWTKYVITLSFIELVFLWPWSSIMHRCRFGTLSSSTPPLVTRSTTTTKTKSQLLWFFATQFYWNAFEWMQKNHSGGTLLGSQDEGESGKKPFFGEYLFGHGFKTEFPFSSIFTKTSCRLSTSQICQPLLPGLITPLDITSRL